jgi:multidrug efflux system outer membrane protein
MTSRLSYLPSLSLDPQGTTSSFDKAKASWTYNVPVSASWEVDIFGRLTNVKRQAKAALSQSQAYSQAVQTQLIANIANLYYTLLMLDRQYEITTETAVKWQESLRATQALMAAGMTTEAAVSQTEATCYSIETSVKDLEQTIRETENTLAVLLGETPQDIERGRLEDQSLTPDLAIGIPVQMLSNRPDVRSAEYALAQAFYGTASARSNFYPSLRLSGSAGWTNSAGSYIVNPGKLLLSAVGSLTQPLFNKGANIAQLKIAKAQQEEAKLTFQQTVLNAGKEVNDALTQAQTAKGKIDLRTHQIESLEDAVRSTQLLMTHGNTTYLEVLTAQQTLLSAQLSQVTDRFDELQATVNLYQALGGGRH